VKWGHQMVSGINGLVTVGECNSILADPLFDIYMQAILACASGIIVGCPLMIRFIVDGPRQSCEAAPVAKTNPPPCVYAQKV
jgi:hypothetical protein